jgi:hypothetical protein
MPRGEMEARVRKGTKLTSGARGSTRGERRLRDRKAQPKEENVFLRVRQWDAGQTGRLIGAVAYGGVMGLLGGLGQLSRTPGGIQMEK